MAKSKTATKKTTPKKAEKEKKEDKKETKETAATTKSAPKTPKNIPSAVFKDLAYEKIAKVASDAEKIEALTKGYDSPGKFTFGGYNAKSYQPDALGHYEDRVDVFSLEGEASKKAIAKNLGKWILFSLEAKKGRGTFYIVTTKACFKAIDEIISSKQINAELITVD